MKTAIITGSFVGIIIATIYLWLTVPSDKLLNRLLWGENKENTIQAISVVLYCIGALLFLWAVVYIINVINYYKAEYEQDDIN